MGFNFAHVRRAASLLVMAAAGVATAETLRLPHERKAEFLGVASCGSSQCHGSAEPWRNAAVSMKERLIWATHDPHAQAFATLRGEQGKRIAHNLELGDAGQAPECLVCHSTYVPAELRGSLFTLEAGVGCESCHGAGGDFLAAHVQPTSRHASNVAAGLYPTTDPAARARLCLSCHQGDAIRRVTHRLYGAGHPRLRFELDTYSALQPAHFSADADYRRRKPLASHFQWWATGQLHAARSLVEPAGTAPGLFPELARFDCHSCHRPITVNAAQPRSGLAPGALSLNDTSLVVLRALVARVLPAELDAFTADIRAWRATFVDNTAHTGVGQRLRATIDRLATVLEARDSTDGRAVVHALLIEANREQPLSFSAAESVAMGAATLLTAEFEQQRLSAAQFKQVSERLDRVYGAVGNEQTYRSRDFHAALAELAKVLKKP